MKPLLLVLCPALFVGCSSSPRIVGQWSAQNPPPGVTNWNATFERDGTVRVAYDVEQRATQPPTVTRRSEGRWSQIDAQQASITMSYDGTEERAIARLNGSDRMVLSGEQTSHPDLLLKRKG